MTASRLGNPSSRRAGSASTGAVIVLAMVAAATGVGSYLMWQQQQAMLREMRQEIGNLRADQGTLKAQLAALQASGCTVPGQKPLPAQQNPFAPPKTPVKKVATHITTGDDPFRGSPDAKVVLIEFSDYECPYCGKYNREIMPQIEQNYIKTGKVRYVFRDYPLEQIHPQAFKAAEAVRCAGEQGRYWEMHSQLFNNQDKLDVPNLESHAASLSLDGDAFSTCLDSGKFAQGIRTDMADGSEAGVTGTPNFYIATIDPKNPKSPNLLVHKKLTGGSYEAMKKELDEVLRQVSSKPSSTKPAN